MTTIAAFGLTDVGKAREENEDQFFIGTLHKVLEVQQSSLSTAEAVDYFTRTDARMLLVADGVGGVEGGRRASQTAVHTLATYIGRAATCCYDFSVEQEDEFLSKLEQALGRAHEAVRSLGARDTGPATTVTLAVVIGDRAYVAHVGDSRCYHFRAGRLRQVTRDQTMGDFLADEGALTEDQAKNLGMSNILASAVGGPEMYPALGLIDLVAGDALLLCTDGLVKHVGDDEIGKVMASGGTPEQTCRTLVNAALAAGGSDNVTVVVARAG